MRFTLETEINNLTQNPVVGNVYNVRGGSGAKHGHMTVIISITDRMCTVVSINKEGDIVGASNYGLHYFEGKCPIAFCDGLEDLSFKIRNIL